MKRSPATSWFRAKLAKLAKTGKGAGTGSNHLKMLFYHSLAAWFRDRGAKLWGVNVVALVNCLNMQKQERSGRVARF
jgi:hypothetical protein